MSPPPSNGRVLDWKDLVNGGLLQCVEAATLGMPFEVWKTRMGRFRKESTVEAFVNVYKRGGVGAFWQGVVPKLIESASKGSILLFSKEGIFSCLTNVGCSETTSGFIAGAGAGVCQVVVMGPCTFLVTAAVTGADKSTSMMTTLTRAWRDKGIRGLYPGGTAIAVRQATNWSSRQGITEAVRSSFKRAGRKDKLTVTEEATSGILGGMLSTWNQPFEVARIHMQAAANEGKPKQSLPQVLAHIYRVDGPMGLFKGIIPRMGLGIWQTLFMVTGAKLIKEHLNW
eukprot:GHVS01058454.1.p1 GENE.GHVS01058454.1~~GHVS01058454.1.p1  ORF type:complete len:284 (+),score=20.47 GHVS01058454.1:207-1058(+)